MRGNIIVTTQRRITFVSRYHFNIFQATLTMSFRLCSSCYIMFRMILVLNISTERQARICLVRLQGSLYYVCLKYFSKTFELQLLQGNDTVKNIMNFLYNNYDFRSIYKNALKYTKATMNRCSIKIDRHQRSDKRLLTGTLLEMTSFANISQFTTNVEQLFYKT